MVQRLKTALLKWLKDVAYFWDIFGAMPCRKCGSRERRYVGYYEEKSVCANCGGDYR